MPKAIVTVGQPFIGKTSYVRASFCGFHYMNSDTFDDSLFPPGFVDELFAAIREQKDIVIDGCNSSPVKRISILDVLRPSNYECLAYHFDLPIAWSNKLGAPLLPDKEFRRTYLDIKQAITRNPPRLQEGFSQIETLKELKYIAPKSERPPALFFQVHAVAHSADDLNGFTSPNRIQVCHDVDSVLISYHSRGYVLIGIGQLSSLPEIGYQDCLIEVLKKVKPPIKEIFYCRHRHGEVKPNQKCSCRLPAAGLAIHASVKYGIDLSQSLMVGADKFDEAFAMNAGIGQYFDREVFFQEALSAT